MVDVIAEIAAERRRQIDVEGWTPEHDDREHEPGELSRAGACYALGFTEIRASTCTYRFWPFEDAWWKPKGRRRDLVRAAALIVAEIERLDRQKAQPND